MLQLAKLSTRPNTRLSSGLNCIQCCPLLQLYDVSNSTAIKLGEPVVLSITGGSGTDADPYQASLGPFAQPLRITAAIQAKGGAGSATTALSAQSNEAVVGKSRQQAA